MDHAVLVQVLDVLEDAALAEVDGMVVRLGHHPEPHPLQVFDVPGVAAHVRAYALVGGRMLVIVKQHLGMNVCGVRAADELHQPQEIRLRVHLEALADQGLAGDGEIDVVALGRIQGAVVVVLGLGLRFHASSSLSAASAAFG